jgi:hypothetical protein
MADMRRVTLFVMHGDDDADYRLIEAWFARWKDQIVIMDYSTGGWEHLWDVETTPEALAEVHSDWLCASAWSDSKLP